MKRFLIFLGFVSLIFLSRSPCDSQTIVNGSGIIDKDLREVSNFRKVVVIGSGFLRITQGEKESLEIKCDKNIFEYIQTVVKNGILEIGPKDVSLRPSRPIEYTLFLKHLNLLKILGSASVEIDDLEAENFKAILSKSESFSVKKINAQSLAFEISGSGKVSVGSGTANLQKISIQGSAKFSAPKLKSEDIEIDIAGSGNAKIWVTNKLEVKIAGSGQIQYYGSPTVSRDISAAGKLERLGLKP
jgi:uncharacterized RmlC-like cupin family protein